MNRRELLLSLVAATLVVAGAPSAANAAPASSAGASPSAPHRATLLVTGLEGGSGSTVGPDGALYVPETRAGRITRVDPRTGHTTTFASGLPTQVIGVGGVMDVAFIGHTAYALVTLVGPDVGGTSTVGLYRVDGPSSFTVVADIGAFAQAHPPHTDFVVPTGVQYAMQRFGRGFLVTDGHHNRVLTVGLDGRVTELVAFDDIVPTGLAISCNRVYMAEAGPVPHLPADGRIVSFGLRSPAPKQVAAGGRLLVDVELGPWDSLYALAQGVFPVGNPPGSPALPNTGQLLRVERDGSFRLVSDGLNQPTSLEIIGHTAYVVTLGGEIWTVHGLGEPSGRTP